SNLPLVITLSDVDSLKPTADVQFATLFNFDDKAASSATDDAESEYPVWTNTHAAKPLPIGAWSREGTAAGHVWHGDDLPGVADESLVSPDLVVGSATAFTIAFKHHYSFELGPVTPTSANVYFDNGVLELSED